MLVDDERLLTVMTAAHATRRRLEWRAVTA
jgi:hypothetical protein